MAILLTGLTGEVGSALAPILNTREKVFCLVRNGKSRVTNGKLDKIPASQIIDGDIFDKKHCGISITDVAFLKNQKITKIVHGAGSVKFDENLADEIWEANFTGTKNVLSLAKELGVEEFHYLSTAYASTQRNPYERSKAAAEELVKKSGIAHSIYRLSIVIGDSETCHAKGFNGYYGFFAGPYRMKEKISKKNKTNGKLNLPIYIDCSFESTLNLIPVDWATKILAELINLKCENKVFHIVHPDPPKVQWVMKEGFQAIGIKGVQYNDYRHVQPKQTDRFLRVIQKAVNKELGRYSPYVTKEEKFSQKTLRECLDGNYVKPLPITSELLKKLLDYAMKKNFKPKETPSKDIPARNNKG